MYCLSLLLCFHAVQLVGNVHLPVHDQLPQASLMISRPACVPAGAGYFFGNLPFVKENFTLVILAIVLTSVLPVVIELANERRKSSRLPPGTTGIGNA